MQETGERRIGGKEGTESLSSFSAHISDVRAQTPSSGCIQSLSTAHIIDVRAQTPSSGCIQAASPLHNLTLYPQMKTQVHTHFPFIHNRTHFPETSREGSLHAGLWGKPPNYAWNPELLPVERVLAISQNSHGINCMRHSWWGIQGSNHRVVSVPCEL